MLAGAAPSSATPWREKVSPWVLETPSEGDAEFLVYLSTQAKMSATSELPTKIEKGESVYKMLTSTTLNTQKGLLAKLDSQGVAYRPYWIANMVWVRASLSTIQAIIERPDKPICKPTRK